MHARRLIVGLLTFLSGAGAVSEERKGLAIAQAGARLAHVTYNGEPLLAFGPHFEHMFFDNYDVEGWTKWAVAHGMNHCRTRLYHAYYTDISPFERMPDGRFDLTKWDDSFWERFHRICSHLQENGVIVHMLIWPQGSGGNWWQGDGYYLAKNNVHPETAFIRPEKSTAGFWQSWSKGKRDLYEIQTAILWKLIDESARYDNIYYDICHEPFLHAMKPDQLADFRAFMDETTRRFVERYREASGGRDPVMGFDTDFTPPGETRDWIYGHDRFNLMIQGKNHDPFYVTAEDAIGLVKRFGKPFMPQESLDPPGVVHIPDVKHKNGLSFANVYMRNHLRKYVWRWIMARSQLIDIYQKDLTKKLDVPERYDPNGYNPFEDDAVIIRAVFDALTDYPNLDFAGVVEEAPGDLDMVLSSEREALVYLSSAPGAEEVSYEAGEVRLSGLNLADGTYTVGVWRPAAPGGLLESVVARAADGRLDVGIAAFTDDLVLLVQADEVE